MAKHQEEEERAHTLRSKAAHFVSDLTTVILNPISDKPSKPSISVEDRDSDATKLGFEEPGNTGNDPDTSSFTAFLYSFLSSPESGNKPGYDQQNEYPEESDVPILRDSGRKRSLFSRGKQSLGRAIHQLGRIRNLSSSKGRTEVVIGDGTTSNITQDAEIPLQTVKEPLPSENLPETSEPSFLLSNKTRTVLNSALPVLIQGRKWVLLYSTWRHGISLSTLYRRSMLLPGLSLLVVGDRSGAVFGGLVEAPLRPTNRRYQGTKDSFVFTNVSGHPVVFRPTGVNRYYTLCSMDYIALGGGSHFALYLDGDLLIGSSSASETYGNSCLSSTEDFEVKEVELWGFVYASKYEELSSLLRFEAPGISRW